MRLESIRERYEDIEQLRAVCQENEAALGKRTSVYGTAQGEDGISSLSLRFFICVLILIALVFADYSQVPEGKEIAGKVKEALSYHITAEDIESLGEICYTGIKELINWKTE